MSYLIKAATPGSAWRQAISYIKANGQEVTTEDGQRTLEVLNLMIEIENPDIGWPFDGSWNMPKLTEYAEQLTTFSYDCKGFDYMYNERMGRQKFYVVKKLKENPTTRRATMYLWIPEKDLETGLHCPCQVVADYKYRGGGLNASHFFRSHDFGGAYPQNLFALARLRAQIAQEVGVDPGNLSTISGSAHIYLD